MPLLMSAFTPKANIGPQSLHVRFGSKADICSAKSHVRFTPKSGHLQCKAFVNERQRSADLPSPPSICRPISAMARW